MTQPTSEDLERIPLLASLNPRAKERLARRFEVVEYGNNDQIVVEGSHGTDLYIIASGRAAATQRERGLLRIMGPGEFFGEIALLGRGRRTATITASSSMVVWVLRGNAIRSLQVDSPEVTKALVTAMGDRLATDW